MILVPRIRWGIQLYFFAETADLVIVLCESIIIIIMVTCNYVCNTLTLLTLLLTLLTNNWFKEVLETRDRNDEEVIWFRFSCFVVHARLHHTIIMSKNRKINQQFQPFDLNLVMVRSPNIINYPQNQLQIRFNWYLSCKSNQLGVVKTTENGLRCTSTLALIK